MVYLRYTGSNVSSGQIRLVLDGGNIKKKGQ